MAAKKKSASSLLDTLSALAPPADARGTSRARGLGKNPTVEAFLGCGFPHMVVTTDEPCAKPPTVAEFQKRFPYGMVTNVMPRWAVPKLYRMRIYTSDEEMQAALDEEAPLDLDAEAELALRDGRRQLWLFEAELGTEKVLEALIGKMSSIDVDAWRHTNHIRSYLRGIGMMLLRVPATTRARHVEALEALFDELFDAEPSRAAKGLDVILHGRKGVERSSETSNGVRFLGEYVWASDDPTWVADSVLARLATVRPADREIFDAQLVVAGGPPLVDAFRSSQAKFQVPFRKKMLAEEQLFR